MNGNNQAGSTVNIDFTQNITVSPEALFQEVGGETVILDLKSEQYFSLDETGSRIWLLLQENTDLQSAYETMLTEYDVDSEVLKTDIQRLLGELLDAGLINKA